MKTQEVMALYNRYERKEYEIPGWEKLATAQVVKVVSPDVDGSFIAYFELSDDQTSAAIDKEVTFFTRLGKNFEWKTYDSDQPANIGVMLLQKGFVAEDPESFMALDLASCELPEPQTLCTEVMDEEGIRDAMRVKQALRGEACQAQLLHLIETKQQDPESIRIYVVYQDGKPVSSAWITFNGASPFAGIWGGSTLPEYRGRGCYQALLKQRIRDAKLAGKQYLIIDASEMSRPIVEKYGFMFVAHTTPYVYRVASL